MDANTLLSMGFTDNGEFFSYKNWVHIMEWSNDSGSKWFIQVTNDPSDDGWIEFNGVHYVIQGIIFALRESTND